MTIAPTYSTTTDGDTTTIHATCPLCDDTKDIAVPTFGFHRWKQGALIQNALPEISAGDRERLITGYCEECWNTLFPDDEDTDYGF
jgi:hypothetical protein